MNFALLWVDVLVIALLWVATLLACIGRIRRRWVRGTFDVLAVLVPVLLLGGAVAAAASLKAMQVEPNWFVYVLSLLVCFAGGTGILFLKTRVNGPELAPATAYWARLPLALAFLAAVSVGYMVLVNMDQAIRAREEILSVEVQSVYLASLPAITSDSQNAALLYEKAFDDLKGDEPKELHNPPVGDGDTFDPNEPATLAFLARHQGALKLLRQGAAMPGCRFEEDLEEISINDLMPLLNIERQAANVLRLDAKEQLAKGHAAGAIEDAAAIGRMARHFGQRPKIIAGLVGIGVAAVADATLEEALPAVRSGEELSSLHLDELTQMGRPFGQSLRGEERFGLSMLGSLPSVSPTVGSEYVRNVYSTSPRANVGGDIRGAFFRVFFADPESYIEVMEGLQKLAAEPYYRAHDAANALQESSKHRGLFTSMLATSLDRALQACAKVQASDDCALAAVAITRYRLDHGAFPTSLNDLVPQYMDSVPIDPFDGKPLRLSTRNNTSVIYSVGPDLLDDGGVEIKKDKGDVIFTLKSASATTTPSTISN